MGGAKAVEIIQGQDAELGVGLVLICFIAVKGIVASESLNLRCLGC
jgi:hypothetical protein